MYACMHAWMDVCLFVCMCGLCVDCYLLVCFGGLKRHRCPCSMCGQTLDQSYSFNCSSRGRGGGGGTDLDFDRVNLLLCPSWQRRAQGPESNLCNHCFGMHHHISSLPL